MFNSLYSAGKIAFIYITSLFIITTASAQKDTSTVGLPNAYLHNLHSDITGQDYKLFVSLPDSYKADDSVHYPVLYLLDGNPFFPLIQSMQKFYVSGEEVPEMIIVGIGYPVNSVIESMPNRTLDYTPTQDTAFDNMLTKELKMQIKSGGASSFLPALKQDILPYIEARYKASNDRAIVGHSFGALFGSYVLFHDPALFSKYLLSSVSMPWDKDEMLQEEQQFFKTGNRTINAHVFLSVGEKESFNMIPLMQQLARSIREHKYQGLTIEEHIFQNESHTSVVSTALNHGLRALYQQENNKK